MLDGRDDPFTEEATIKNLGNDEVGPPRNVSVREGNPGRQLIETFKEVKPDLNVLGRHRQRPTRDFLAGTIAAGVLSERKCPVLIVDGLARSGASVSTIAPSTWPLEPRQPFAQRGEPTNVRPREYARAHRVSARRTATGNSSPPTKRSCR